MENKITPEMIEQAKKAQSVEELLALAKKNGIALNEEKAQELFDRWHTTRELSDNELDSISGGCGSGDAPAPTPAPSTKTCPKCSYTWTPSSATGVTKPGSGDAAPLLWGLREEPGRTYTKCPSCGADVT